MDAKIQKKPVIGTCKHIQSKKYEIEIFYNPWYKPKVIFTARLRRIKEYEVGAVLGSRRNTRFI